MPRNQGSAAVVSRDDGDGFDATTYLKKDDYDADIEAIKVRLDGLETRVKDRAALAGSVADAFDNDRNLDPILIKVMKNHVIHEESVKVEIKKVVDKVDRDWFKSFMKRIGIAIGAIVIALISGLAGYFIPR
jgi:hypothetical protein